MEAVSAGMKQPDVIDGAFGNEVVIVNFDTGRYYHTEGTGSVIWERLKQGATLEEIIQEMMAAYRHAQDRIETSVRRFVSELLNEGLIVAPAQGLAAGVAERQSSTPPAAKIWAAAFQEPHLDGYSDLEDILDGSLLS